MWLHTQDGTYTIKSSYHVAVEILKIEKNWPESSCSPPSNNVWEEYGSLGFQIKLRESGIHELWECEVARDIWASSVVKLQKFVVGQQDVIQLFEELLVRLEVEELELFLVQAWFIWNRRNSVLHGGVLQAPKLLNKRAEDFLAEFHQA
uniref:Uncharacterized protein n=1 Tax=Quercus lobata TaxID=97700 RepID=A0A7N2L6Q0_QUELO